MKNNNISTIIADTLLSNLTIHNTKASTISGDQIGADLFAKWKEAQEVAYQAFYRYQHAKTVASISGTDAKVDPAIVTNAMNALQALLDMIGNVTGHKIAKNPDMLDEVSAYAMSDRKDLAGKAWTLNEKVKQYKKDLKNVHEGMREEYVKSLQDGLAQAEEELAIAKKGTDSASKYNTRRPFSTFRTKMEEKLAKIIKGQAAKTWEELEAEKAKIDAERKARRAQAKKASK